MPYNSCQPFISDGSFLDHRDTVPSFTHPFPYCWYVISSIILYHAFCAQILMAISIVYLHIFLEVEFLEEDSS